MKRSLRFWFALWAGKLAIILLRLAGKKGTTFPGLIGVRLYPYLMKDLGENYTEGIVIVTGTNGKTTTANLLANILRASGIRAAFNEAGANMVTGITGALLENTTWTGKSKVKLALLEVDEATIPKVCQMITPKLAIVTNFFRDQLDRYGELDTTIKLVKEAIPGETRLILNADDPLVAQFETENSQAFFYGVERTPESDVQSRETREARFCPQCGEALQYTLFHYGQLGIYNCPGCSFTRPKPNVLAQQVRMEEGQLVFRVGVTTYVTALQGYYNLYNALAALSAAQQIGIKDRYIEQGLRQFIPQAGRMERFLLSEGPLTLTLVKNPTGFNQVIRTITAQQGIKHLLIAINDLAADGRDVSWLWDVDFELLGEHQSDFSKIVCSGLRAEDMALRLKYANIPTEKLILEHDLEQAVNIVQGERSGKDSVYILPTYTVLFPMRELLEKRNVTAGTLPSQTASEGGR